MRKPDPSPAEPEKSPEGRQERLLVAFGWIVLGLAVLHLSAGILPIAAVEGDEQGIVNGVLAWKLARPDFSEVAYNYAIQPGTFRLLYFFSELLDAEPLTVFGVLSAIGALAFAGLSALLVSNVCSVRVLYVLLGYVSVQELWSAAFYANSSAIAAPAVILGFLAAIRFDHVLGSIIAGVLLSIGGWLRMDSLLVAPAFLLLVYKPNAGWWPAILRTSVAAITCLASLWVLFSASEVSLTDALQSYRDRDGAGSWNELFNLIWYVGSAPWLCVVLIGVGLLVVKKQWLPLFIFAAGVVLTLAVYGRSFTTTKYCYFAIPFAAIPAAEFFKYLKAANGKVLQAAFVVCVAAIVTDTLLGIRTSSAEYRRFDVSDSPAIGTLRLGPKAVQVVFGEGEILPTHDGFRLRGALLHAPSVWRNLKQDSNREYHRIANTLLRAEGNTIVAITYLSWRVVDSVLIKQGFVRESTRVGRFASGSTFEVWRGPRTVHVAKINLSQHARMEIEELLDRDQVILVNDLGENAAERLGMSPLTVLQSPNPNGLITLRGEK
jgi:hypothetical protein